jgi:hypothetical protein
MFSRGKEKIQMSDVKHPHMYAIFHDADKSNEELELSLKEVTEDRIVDVIVQLFLMIPTPDWRNEAMRRLNKAMMENSVPYPAQGSTTVQ